MPRTGHERRIFRKSATRQELFSIFKNFLNVPIKGLHHPTCGSINGKLHNTRNSNAKQYRGSKKGQGIVTTEHQPEKPELGGKGKQRTAGHWNNPNKNESKAKTNPTDHNREMQRLTAR